MKILIATFAMTLALAFSGPVFAGATTTKTEADCAKAGGTWNATTKMCKEKKMYIDRCFERFEGASASVGALLLGGGMAYRA